MIDADGYRLNVGIIIINKENKVFWGRRATRSSWQFPQGGIDENESLLDAMYRELFEETGLKPEHVEIIAATDDWVSYDLPYRYRRKNAMPLCIGQKQKWFLLRLQASDEMFDFNQADKAEFDDFRWVDYWYPIHQVIYFKRRVYQNVLNELSTKAGISKNKRRLPYTYQKKNKMTVRRRSYAHKKCPENRLTNLAKR